MKRYTIGVIIGNANSPHTKSLMRGVHNAAGKLDVNVIFFLGVHMTYYYRAYFGEEMEDTFDFQYNVVYDYSLLADVDALIISYGSLCIFLEDKNKERFMKRFKGIPYVLLEERDESGEGSTIISDNYSGMFQLTEHLLKVHGYRRFTYLSGPENNTDANERKEAFIAALKKYQIPVTPDMIEIGDFSNCVEEQIERLLKNHPDAEAIVCANDVMAEAAYHVCNRHGLVVGRDIAVTGYDDWNMAESMTPPLTTVLQNEFDMGYTALERAYDLCLGKEPMDLVAPAIVKIRASCGCKNAALFRFPKPLLNDKEHNEEYIEGVVKTLNNKILLSNVSDEIKQGVAAQLREVVKENLSIYQRSEISKFDKEIIMSQMNGLIAGKYGAYVSPVSITDGVSAYLKNVIKYENDVKKIAALSELLASVQKYIQSSVIKLNKDDLDDFQQDAMFMPLISGDMMNHIGNEIEFYKAPMRVLSALRAKSSYLLIMEEPVKHNFGEEWKCPDKMYLASYHEGSNIVSYLPKERPVITKKSGITDMIHRDKGTVLSTFNLHLGELQFGILVSEIDPADMILLHLASLQISTALNFHVSYQKQHLMQQKLEKLVEEVKEKNKILGFISEYDELTGCLNRRGFMEKAVNLIHKKQGSKAVVILCDLDHLKEINDRFGHVEGDFAIKKAAEILKTALGKNTLVARVGGDEFIAILPFDPQCGGKKLVRKIKENDCAFNTDSEKGYYVEISAGYTEFVCDPDRDFNSIMAEADLMLYEAKKTRRSSICK